MPAKKQADTAERRVTPLWNLLAAFWGLVGFALLIGQALMRFFPIVREAVTGPVSTDQLVGTSLSIAIFAVGKGYLILQRQFAPRFARRVRELATPPTRLIYGILAPLYCLNLVGAARSSLIRGYLLLGAIVLMIIGAKQLPESWYGAVLAGVAVALTWGVIAVAIQSVRSLRAQSLVTYQQAGDADVLVPDEITVRADAA